MRFTRNLITANYLELLEEDLKKKRSMANIVSGRRGKVVVRIVSR